MSSATGRNPTDAGSLLTGRRRLPPGDAANAANPVNAPAFTGLQRCGLPRSPRPLSTLFSLHCPVRQRLTYFPNIPSPLTLTLLPSTAPSDLV